MTSDGSAGGQPGADNAPARLSLGRALRHAEQVLDWNRTDYRDGLAVTRTISANGVFHVEDVTPGHISAAFAKWRADGIMEPSLRRRRECIVAMGLKLPESETSC